MNKPILLVVLLMIFAGCKTSGDAKLVGEWEITRFVYAMVKQKTVVSEEDELNDSGAYWNLNFSRNGDFSQVFNMRSQDKKAERETGRWSSSNDTLQIIIHSDKQQPPLVYTYKFENDLLVMSIKGPQGLSQVVSTFRRR